MRTFTSAEARAALGVDAKTFLRWLKKANMEPSVSRRDNRIKLFTQQQLEQLAQEHERTIDFEARQQAETLPSAEERIEALEQRVSELERKLDTLSTGTKPSPIKTPRDRILHEASTELPAGETVPARTFAERHGFTRDLMKGWIKREEIKATPVPYQGKMQDQLTQEQQREALHFWRTDSRYAPQFHECTVMGCPCQETLV